ncbi:hypothetical protein [Mycobacterium sp.]
MLTHLQHASLDDAAAAAVMLSEVGPAEQALDGITAPHRSS